MQFIWFFSDEPRNGIGFDLTIKLAVDVSVRISGSMTLLELRLVHDESVLDRH